MPYDPRPTSQGGNRGIDELFERNAPTGMFRVIGVDTFDGTDWTEGDFGTKEEAVAHADKRGSRMLKMHVYDEHGNHIHDAGTL